MTEKDQLISDLRRIQENQYSLQDGGSIFRYTERMLRYIGDPDPELRDDLIYSTFCEWICEKEYYTDEELRRIMGLLLDHDHIFYHIGNAGDDTVYTRTFSILVVVLILCRHRQRAVFDYDTVIQIKDALIQYYTGEKDFRGYTDEHGWAHGAAHGADAMEELARCAECNEAMSREMLEAIRKVLHNDSYLLCNEEDERIARAAYRMITGNLVSGQFFNQWLEDLSRCCEWERTRKQYIARVNSKNFIRCLYFKLLHHRAETGMLDHLRIIEGRLNRFLQAD